MANKSDGTVYIDTRIDTSGINRGVEDAKRSINSASESVKKFGHTLQKSFSGVSAEKAGRAYEEIERDIKKAEVQLDKLIEKQIRFVETGGNTKSRAMAGMEYDIEMARNKLFGLREELSKTEKTAPKSMNVLKKGVEKTTKSINKMGNTAKKANFSLLKMLGTSLLFSLVFRALSAIMNGFAEGVNNLVMYSDDANTTMSALKSSLTQVKNSFATAFMPLITWVTPAIQKFLSVIIQANNILAQFFAALSGKTTYTKAVQVQEDYRKSLEGTAAAAKKTQKYLSGLDEIRTYSSNEESAGGEISPADMFEEVPIDTKVFDFIEKMKDGISSVIPKVKELADLFAMGFKDGLGDFQPRLDTIKEGLLSIKDSLVNIFTDPKVGNSFNNFLESFVYALGQVLGSIGSIGLTIGANLIGGLAKYLEQNTSRIKEYIISMFDIGTEISKVVGNLSSAIAYIFEAFSSEDAQQITADIIAIFAELFMGITEVGASFALDFFSIFALPIINSKEQIKIALQDLLAGMSEIFELIKTVVADSMDFIRGIYEEFIAPIFEKTAESLTSLLQESLLPLISQVGEFLGSVGEALLALWEGILQPFIQWIIENILPVLVPIFENVVDIISKAVGSISDIISGLLQILEGVIDFITGVFTGDWEKAWNGIKDIFGGICEALVAVFKAPFNVIIGVLNGVMNGIAGGINLIIDGINSLNFTVPDWVPFVGGSRIGFNVPRVTAPQIPMLATGAVIPPNAPFMAMLGDQKHGTNIEAPLDTIKQAVREVVGNGNGGVLHAHLYLGGKEVLETVIDMAKLEQTSTGVNPLLLT